MNNYQQLMESVSKYVELFDSARVSLNRGDLAEARELILQGLRLTEELRVNFSALNREVESLRADTLACRARDFTQLKDILENKNF